MEADLRTLGRDERMHVFLHEALGIYRHYSYPRWEKLPVERLEDDGRPYTLEEAKAWIEAQMMAGDPISQEEVESFRRGWWATYEGRAAVEPDYPEPPLENPDKPSKGKPKSGQFKCDICRKDFFAPKFSYGFHAELCKSCWLKLGGLGG